MVGGHALELDRVFERFDVIATPTSPSVAFRIGEKMDDPMAMKLADVCTIPINMAGTCAISIPCGLGPDGLPVGFQIMGKLMDEPTVLRAAHALEQDLGFLARPRLVDELGPS